jgi:hypothetical protein
VDRAGHRAGDDDLAAQRHLEILPESRSRVGR